MKSLHEDASYPLVADTTRPAIDHDGLRQCINLVGAALVFNEPRTLLTLTRIAFRLCLVVGTASRCPRLHLAPHDHPARSRVDHHGRHRRLQLARQALKPTGERTLARYGGWSLRRRRLLFVGLARLLSISAPRPEARSSPRQTPRRWISLGCCDVLMLGSLQLERAEHTRAARVHVAQHGGRVGSEDLPPAAATNAFFRLLRDSVLKSPPIVRKGRQGNSIARE